MKILGVGLLAVLTACSGATSETTIITPSPSVVTAPTDAAGLGCDLISGHRLRGEIGARAVSRPLGSVARFPGSPVGCRVSVPGARFPTLTLVVRRHPAPFRLPRTDCNQGWVVAGTPAHQGQACQHTDARSGSVTRLYAREGKDLVTVTIARAREDWAGDPELALLLADEAAAALTQ